MSSIYENIIQERGLGKKTVEGVVHVIDSYQYDDSWKQAYEVRSVFQCLCSDRMNCIEAMLCSTALLRWIGLIEIKGLAIHRISSDGYECGHVFTIYFDKEKTAWGVISKSQYAGMGHYSPQFKSIDDIAKKFARSYQAIGMRPLYYGVFDIEDVACNIDWEKSLNYITNISDVIIKNYQFEFENKNEKNKN